MYLQDRVTLADQYRQGLSDEKRVIATFESIVPKGSIRPSTKDENIFQDIDFWIDDVSVSVKAQHSGLKYNNIYFELLQAPKLLKDPITSERVMSQLSIQPEQIGVLEECGWVPSWYYSGLADVYAILQGTRILVYKKRDIVGFVKTHGFLRIKQLTPDRRRYLKEANYRYTNALCGYLYPNKMVHSVIELL